MKVHGWNLGWVCAGLMAITISPARPAETTETNPLVEGNPAFALQLYGKLRSTEGNLVLSPYSISSALAMTCAGARGDTARQMEQALHFDQTRTNADELFSRLNVALKLAKGSNELSMANSLWPQKKYRLRDEFLNRLKADYGATVTPLDYTQESEKARETINKWVDEKTRHKITGIIGPGVLDGLTRMVLVNAIYFKGTWAVPFPASSTQADKFFVRPNQAVTVPFMRQRGHFKYGETDRLQLLAIPYEGRQLEMILLLPRDRDGLEQLESSLTPASLAAWTAGMKEQEVNVAMPKFKMSGGLTLNETLQSMGIKDAFDPARADFSGMDGRPHWLCLSAVLHKAYIDVNEQGTEAAASTAVAVRATVVLREDLPREFRADHPFVFLLRDSTSGSILFMGRVSEPENH